MISSRVHETQEELRALGRSQQARPGSWGRTRRMAPTSWPAMVPVF